MSNKKGFTLVELLAVIAILAILVLITMPNIVGMFTKAKKDTFLIEAKNVYKEVSNKYISETMKGNKLSSINSKDNTRLDLDSNDLAYNIKIDSKGNVEFFTASNNSYCISGKISNINDLTIDKVQDGSCDTTNDGIHCTFDGELVQGAELKKGDYVYRYKQEGRHGERGAFTWSNMNEDGWGVAFNGKDTAESEICAYINDKPIISTSLMFYKYSLSNVDLSSFDTSRVTNMYGMFESLNVDNLDLSTLNTKNVTNMAGMFWGCGAETLDISNFDTSNVTDMSELFRYAKAREVIGLDKLDTSNVTNMKYMFSISKMEYINVSNFNTSEVKTMYGMFTDSMASEIIIGNIDTSNVDDMSGMFSYLKNIETIDLSGITLNENVKLISMFSGTSATKGYAKDIATAEKLNNSYGMPNSLKFVVKK